MKIYDITKEDQLFAFEVGNFFLMRRDVGNAFKSIPGIKVIKTASLRGDEFCICALHERQFVAWEPWGDSSRYWIGPSPPEWNPDIEIVSAAFANFRPFWGPLRAFVFIAYLAAGMLTILNRRFNLFDP